MAKRKLSQLQIICIILLWFFLAGYILLYAELNGITILSIVMSGLIVFISIYKNVKK